MMKLEKELFAYLWQNPYENNCNTYVIKGEKTVLIDPGHSRHLEQLFNQMEKDGISPEEIELVIITHSHPDHFEGLEAFLDKPAKITMSREEERYLLESGKLLFEMMRQPLPKFRIDFYLREGELHLGKEIFNIYSTPGHSPGSLSIYWPERKILFTGDVIFYGGIGRTDFLEGNSKLLMESIERLSRLDTEILLPGHGEMVMGRDLVLQNFEFIRQNFYAYL
jgi:glyoxylase-like metal-dependent hydrolase (beta-lactamase superfamily II)